LIFQVFVFAISVEHPLDEAVQCSQHADARHHGRAAKLDDQEQGFYRGLPLLKILLSLGKLLDVVRGVLEGNELATAWQGNAIVEGARPISHESGLPQLTKTWRRPGVRMLASGTGLS
jgi:hypothetical protein